MRRNSKENYIIAGIVIVILVGVFIKSRKTAPPIALQNPVVATPRTLPAAPVVAATVATPTFQSKKLAATVSIANNTQTDILCLRAERQIFYLPRALALRLTRSLEQNSFLIPASHAACLKSGPWKFWISDFDSVSHLPYRYYFEMTADITEVTPIDLKKYPAFLPDAEIFRKLFGKYFKDNALLQINLKNKKFQNFKLGPTDRPPFLLANSTSGGTAADKGYLEGLLYGSIRSHYLAPSDPQFFKPYAFITENFDFRSRSSLDLTAENLAGIYYRKFGKLPEIKISDWKEGKYSRKDLQNMITFQNYLESPNSYFLVDTRNKRISGNLHLPDAYLLNPGWYEDTYSLQLAFNDELPNSKMQKFLIATIPELIAKARGKKIVLLGNTESDPVPVFMTKQTLGSSKDNFLIMKEGFFEILISSYFFKPVSFVSKLNSPIDIYKDRKFEDYLFLKSTYQSRETVQPKTPNQIRR
ncbi:MAG: hypothetical protein H7326_08915 [Bdellovibrionaceae bacterium]|nr:hypothetical protein [Pseudobdellovibrionaceae bacterium]